MVVVVVVLNFLGASHGTGGDLSVDVVYRYSCLYNKFTTAKKKKYFDGFVVVQPDKKAAALLDAEGKQVSRQRTAAFTLAVDTMITFGSWDAEVGTAVFCCCSS